MATRGAWAALVGCVITILLASGSRTSLAAFLRPIEADLGLDRAVLSTAGALTVLTYGLAQPIVGALAAWLGARRVMIGSTVLMALGGVGVANASEPWQLYVFAGILPGLSFAGASSVPAAVLLAGWFTTRLGLATGIMSSAIPAGQSIFVPLGTLLVPSIGWRATYLLLALAVAVIAVPVLALVVRDPPQPVAHGVSHASPKKPGWDIWLVGVGYFGCGFSDQFVSIHLVALAADSGLDPLVGAGLTSLLLVVGIVGSVGSGPFADRVRPRHMLAGLYLTRALALPLLFLAGPQGVWALVAFGVLFGATYIANQAPGARLVRDRYGVGAVGPLMGSVGLAHQVGGALGVGMGGLSVAQTGTYNLAIAVVIGVVLAAGLSQLLIPRPKLPAP
ncbi:MAG TPA: MFS transporter [Chloroflexota bacterium]